MPALLEHAPYLAMFLIGLLGGVHCVGMCGGIVSALSFGLPTARRTQLGNLLPILLAYNAGRISTYVLLGAVAGTVGALLLTTLSPQTVMDINQGMRVFAALFMIALGLYLAALWQGAAQIEKLGQRLWKSIEPFGRRFIPVDSVAKAFPLGMVWGWLPCGLVYSVLPMAVAAGNSGDGALLLLAFGLGTLPTLLTMGTAAAFLGRLTRNTTVKRIAGFSVIGLGLLLLWQALA
ncbi:MAG: hypothetical protein BWK73_04335 [Thiothrix lacustris]|uniref:Urease accessory protein UreH-like transmembrane domain-containing protein n=1 Tax=Thiothrix lacustris TaxID=525917 RepID=A0A1Y1QY34_9GAMM|nr:MAG: hypothetical protein BWK73_04335 [Thiothrix lacustris]